MQEIKLLKMEIEAKLIDKEETESKKSGNDTDLLKED